MPPRCPCHVPPSRWGGGVAHSLCAQQLQEYTKERNRYLRCRTPQRREKCCRRDPNAPQPVQENVRPGAAHPCRREDKGNHDKPLRSWAAKPPRDAFPPAEKQTDCVRPHPNTTQPCASQTAEFKAVRRGLLSTRHITRTLTAACPSQGADHPKTCYHLDTNTSNHKKGPLSLSMRRHTRYQNQNVALLSPPPAGRGGAPYRSERAIYRPPPLQFF